MDEYLLSYREVIPDQTNAEEWKEIKINNGKFLRLYLKIQITIRIIIYYFVNELI